MAESLSRPLHTPKLVREFLQEILQYQYDVHSNIEHEIADAQLGISQSLQFKRDYNTYDVDDYRCANYVDENSRWELRNTIVNELLTMERLASDDEINLGVGGAKPLTPLISERKVFIVIGLPASGKSGISSTIADNVGALVIDSDYAKRKLPEYHTHKYGASLVNKESSNIINGFANRPARFEHIVSLTELAIYHGHNIVLPKIGQKLQDVVKWAEEYRKFGYGVHLTLVSLDRRKATIRAIKRYVDTKRYVPLGLIFDDFGNDSTLTYYQLKSHFNDLFDSFGIVSTNVDINDVPKCLEYTNDNPAGLYPVADPKTMLLKK